MPRVKGASAAIPRLSTALRLVAAALLLAALVVPFPGERPVSLEPADGAEDDDYAYWLQLRRRDRLPERVRPAFTPAEQQGPRAPERTQEKRKRRGSKLLPPQHPPLPPTAPSQPQPPTPTPTGQTPANADESVAASPLAPVAWSVDADGTTSAVAASLHKTPAQPLRHVKGAHPTGPQLVRSPPPKPVPPHQPPADGSPAAPRGSAPSSGRARRKKAPGRDEPAPSRAPVPSDLLRIQLQPRALSVHRRVEGQADEALQPPAAAAAAAASPPVGRLSGGAPAPVAIALTPRDLVLRRRVVGEGDGAASSWEQGDVLVSRIVGDAGGEGEVDASQRR